MQAVILAAGKGSRLGSLTRWRSKAMQPILGIPMFQRVINSLHPHGIHDFILVVDPADCGIQDYCGRHLSERFNIQVVTQAKKLGTAHALVQARPLIADKFILSACDNLIPSPELDRFFSLWQTDSALDGLLALQEVSNQRIPYGAIVELNGPRVTRIIEKPTIKTAPSNTASLPFYGFSVRILPYLDQLSVSTRGEYELQEAIQKLIDEGGHILGIHLGSRLTLSKPSDLLEINRYYLRKTFPMVETIKTESIGRDTVFIPPIWVGAGASIGSGCRIGPEVYIEGGCNVGPMCQIAHAVILDGSIIPPNEVIKEDIVYT
jgi:bifunctional UDP-N-acetylglucosamine pyrophosphorylase/glucosamine-1-phosphate N-acetyltransferase